jgi:hypothetical protein
MLNIQRMTINIVQLCSESRQSDKMSDKHGYIFKSDVL